MINCGTQWSNVSLLFFFFFFFFFAFGRENFHYCKFLFFTFKLLLYSSHSTDLSYIHEPYTTIGQLLCSHFSLFFDLTLYPVTYLVTSVTVSFMSSLFCPPYLPITGRRID